VIDQEAIGHARRATRARQIISEVESDLEVRRRVGER
jgi:hypothetical protein